MENLPKADELQFTPAQQLAFLADRGSFGDNVEQLPKHAGRSRELDGAKVEVDYDEFFNDHTYKVSVLGYVAVISPDGLSVMKTGQNGLERVTDPEHRMALIGGIATQLRSSIEAADLALAA